MTLLSLHKRPLLDFFVPDTTTIMELPFVASGIKAGFPSPALDFMGETIDLNRELIKHPYETFYARVDGDSMKDAGITDGDILIIDRSLSIPAVDGKIYVCQVDGEFTIKRVRVEKQKHQVAKVWLIPENDAFEPICVTQENEFVIWGRVVNIIKNT